MPERTETETKVPIRVLLVEDHALTRIGLRTVLKRVADILVVGESSNGEEAVAEAARLQPDVILMDVGMPIMDGIQAAREIVGKYPEIKIIMLTQHDNDQDVLASLTAGASGYCLKDVIPERLYTAIRAVNAGDAWLDASIASKVLKHYDSVNRSQSASVSVSELPQIIQLSAKGAPLDRPLPEPLSARELEVLRAIVEGLSNQEIADKLIISLATAKTHVRNILNKLAVDDRTQAAVQGMRRGLV
jgi:DNA-binding NarL/FixJ family response regulator